jgi:hypothetical protein
MFDIVPSFRHRFSRARADRRRARSAQGTAPRRVSFGETIAIGLGCDSRMPQPKRAKLG